MPSLGVLQVAAVLEEDGHDVRVLDLAGYDDAASDAMLDAAIVDGVDVYGITTTTPQFPVSVDLLHTIREKDPGKRVIIGGPHPTVSPDSCSMFDVAVMGNGELGIREAILSNAPKVIDYASNTKKGLVKWHWPARHLIDLSSYKYRLAGKQGTSALFSLGCSYGCLYCGGRLTPYYRRVQFRDVNDVVMEMESLIETYGIGAITSMDDEINLTGQSLIDLCHKLKPLGLKLRGFIKSNLFTDQQAEAMAEAGFVECCTGIESGSDRILGIMQKQTSFAINIRAREIAKKHGMRFKAFTSIGHPGETEWDVIETKRWLLEAKPDDFDVTVISVYPGTPLFDYRKFVEEKDGRRICKYEHSSRRPEENGATLFFEEVDYSREFAFYKGKPKSYTSHVWTPDLSKYDLVRLRDQIEDDVRTGLKIPYPKRYSGDYLEDQLTNDYEHSYGMGMNTQDSRTLLTVHG